jgi:prolyl-tRNA editing enzyme YbaK/EbsC (Cys-tRNA(Pro) deacylase)
MQNAERRIKPHFSSFSILRSAFCIHVFKRPDTIPFVSELDPAVQRHLDSLGLTYQVLDCNPEWADTDVFCANYNIPRQNAANTILVASKSEPKQYSACLVLATTKLDVNHAVSRLMGIKRLSFASADETKAVTGQLIGGVTVFALPDSIPLYVDARIMDAQYVIVGGGNRSTKIRLSPRELERIPGVVVAQIALERI